MWFAPVIFDDDQWWDGEYNNSFARIADVSRDNSFASHHLLNYTDDEFPHFLRAQSVRERPHERAEYAEVRVLGYEGQADIRGITAAAIESSRRVGQSDVGTLVEPSIDQASVGVLGNSDFRLLVLWQGSLHVVDLSAYAGKHIEARPDPRFRVQHQVDIVPAAVLKTYAIASGFVVELLDEVRLVTASASYSLIKMPAARIRTFVHARRYRDTMLVVEEDAVSLVGFMELRE